MRSPTRSASRFSSIASGSTAAINAARGFLRGAHLKVAEACVEDINYKAARGLDKRQIASLASGEWIRRTQNLLITGRPGRARLDRLRPRSTDLSPGRIGALLARTAAHRGLRVAHGDGSYIKFLKSIAKAALLVLDDWGLTAFSTQDRADLLEIFDDRVNTGSTLIASQLPVDTWHAYLGEPTLADAILDRLVHHSHRIELKILANRCVSHARRWRHERTLRF